MGKRIRRISLKSIESETLAIGYAGENEHTIVRFGCSSVFTDYPDATVLLVVQPPQGDLYLATVTVSGENVVWEITASDALYAGSGRYQLVFTDNETEILKSAIGAYTIADSIEPTGDAPEPLQNWMDQAEETALQIARQAAQEAGSLSVATTAEVTSYLGL